MQINLYEWNEKGERIYRYEGKYWILNKYILKEILINLVIDWRVIQQTGGVINTVKLRFRIGMRPSL